MSAPVVEEQTIEGGTDRTVLLTEPMPHQQSLILSPERFKVLICGRRWGKSTVARVMAVAGHGPNGERRGCLDGGQVWWVMPTFPSARETFDYFEFALRDVWVKKNATERFFMLPGGGSLWVKSSDDPESLRGSGLDGAVVDEIKDHVIGTWLDSLRPALSDKQGWLLACGTPGYPHETDLSHYLFARAGGRPDWGRWQEPSHRNPLITPGELASLRDELGPTRFAREIEAQFVSLAGGQFKREAAQRYTALDVERVEHVFATADLAVSTKTWADFTVAVQWGRLLDGRLLVLDVFRERVDGAHVVAKLASLVAKWGAKKLVLDAGGPLSALNSQARAAGLPVVELPIGGKDKVTRNQPLFAAIDQGKILFPASAPWLEATFVELEMFPEPNEHDDVVDAMGLGPRSLTPFRKAVVKERSSKPHPRSFLDDDGRGSFWG